MRLLLDTHTFLWWDADANQLPDSLLSSLQDPTHNLILSVVSVWEMQIKAALGKLELRTPLAKLVSEQRAKNGIHVLPIHLQHVLTLEMLPDHHKDPFDRLLIAQAKSEGLTLVSKDKVFTSYNVPLLWDMRG